MGLELVSQSVDGVRAYATGDPDTAPWRATHLVEEPTKPRRS